jgi:hypothetical protein
MTIIEFFEIIKETPKSVTMRKLQQVEVASGFLSGTTTPTEEYAKDQDGQPVEIRAYKREYNGETNYITRKDGFKKYYYTWNGAPKHYNHCD